MESDATQVVKVINGEMHCPWMIIMLVQEILEEKKNFDKIFLSTVIERIIK